MQNNQEFELIRDLIWEKSGIYFESTKQQYFLRRLHRRMALIGCHRLVDYHRVLTYDTSGAELSELLNLLTTTETYFFRNRQQLLSFEEEVLPASLKRKQASGISHVHIWSAGCSSGEEPYTLAMILLETIPTIAQWKISIAAIDINTQAIERAREGVYAERSFREMPKEYQTKYFTKNGESYHISDQVKRMVTFRVGNLIEKKDTALIQNVDFIFCRNVLIYFNLESCKAVVNTFYDNLAHNGYLFLGHSESLYRITPIFKLMKLQHALVYYKE